MIRKTHIMRGATIAVAGALVTALAVPAFAAPAPRMGRIRTAMASRVATAPVMAKGQPGAMLMNRIENALAARKARFDAANANLQRRIARVTALADKVEAAGGDVSAARATLAAASASLAKANDLEAVAIAKFKDIPNATDKHAAFVAARAAGRLAVVELKNARRSLRASATELRASLKQLKSTNPSETVDAQ